MSKLVLPKLEKPYVHEKATVMGNVTLGDSCSIWPGAVLRADLNTITLGKYVNIQDNSTLHTDYNSQIVIGDYTLVGHNVMIHGAKIGKACLIGIGSILLDNCEIGDGAQITAGCMIRGGKKIPPHSLVFSKNGELQILPNKAKVEATIAGSIEYVILAQRALANDFSRIENFSEIEVLTKALSAELFPK